MPMMEPSDFSGAVPVDGYGPGFFRVRGLLYRGPVLVTERGDSDDMRRATEAQFLSMVLSGRAAAGPVIPALAHELLSQTDGTGKTRLFFDVGR